MDPQVITPMLIGIVVLFAIYRRVRRSFGRQPVRAVALMIRAMLFLVIGIVLGLGVSAFHPALLAALGVGVAAGLVLGYFGLRHTVFETTGQGRFYTPHTYIGLFVIALFLARVGLRSLMVFTQQQQPVGQDVLSNPLIAYQRNPLTLAVFGILVGYYVFYNLGVLKRSRETAVPATLPSVAR
jgi:hypothetical protein